MMNLVERAGRGLAILLHAATHIECLAIDLVLGNAYKFRGWGDAAAEDAVRPVSGPQA